MGNESEVQEKLERLLDARYAADALRLRMQQMIDEVLTPEQRRIIEDIKEEFHADIEAAQACADLQEAELKEMARALGKSVRSQRAQIVYSAGRVSWDNDSLSAIAQTEEFAWLSKFRREGAPVISIRAR